MPDATANYALPYPLGADPPEGDEQIQALAEGVEAEVLRLFTTVRSYGAASSGNLDLTGTITDVPGTSVTFSTNNDGAILLVRAAFDFQYSNTAGQEANECIGYLNVNGTNRGSQVIMRTLANWRVTCGGRWRVPLTSAGSHTVKLRANSTRTAGAADATVHTGWVALLLDG